MGVSVDAARNDQLVGAIDDGSCLVGLVGCHGCNLPILNEHICIDAEIRVDNSGIFGKICTKVPKVPKE